MKQTQTIIVGCMVVSVANATVANLTTSNTKAPAIKILIGGWVLTVGLLLASELQPELAESAAILVVMASLFGPNGDALAKVLTGVTTGKVSLSPVKGKESTSGVLQETLTTAGDTNPSALGPVAVARAVGLKTGAIQPTLVAIPGTSFLLDKDAVQAYLKAVEYYGAPIPLTGTWRSEASQKAAYEANPNGTFGATSLHPKGLAVDVNGNQVNLLDPKLYDAFTKAGWYRRGKKLVQNGVLQPELWHYSFGVPG